MVLADNSFKFGFLSEQNLKKQIRAESFSTWIKVLESAGFSTKSLQQNHHIQKIRDEIF